MLAEGNTFIDTVPSGASVEILPDGRVWVHLPDGSNRVHTLSFGADGMAVKTDAFGPVTIGASKA